MQENLILFGGPDSPLTLEVPTVSQNKRSGLAERSSEGGGSFDQPLGPGYGSPTFYLIRGRFLCTD